MIPALETPCKMEPATLPMSVTQETELLRERAPVDMVSAVSVSWVKFSHLLEYIPFMTINDNSFSVDKGCGETSSENSTYFKSAGAMASGACTLEICRCNNNICQVIYFLHLAQGAMI